MSLLERLTREIASLGPISVAAYMDRCLHDPTDGYYATRPRLGGEGDFITAPHVSQMFGELIGLWAAEVWTRLGSPPRVRLVEMGPGDGTMMRDMLRAARLVPDFLAALDPWLIETSGPLVAPQREALGGRPAAWATALGDIPVDRPMILIANEFLDCLPIRQWVQGRAGWTERLIGLDDTGGLAFVSGCPSPPGEGGRDTAILETCDELTTMGRQIGEVIAEASGAALFIDYGGDAAGSGDTLQALRGHRKEHSLASPGEADLTAHVDFPAFLAAARRTAGIEAAMRSQREFLLSLGIEPRAAVLSRARPDQAPVIARQLARLIAPDQMGGLFKAACVHSQGLQIPGFEATA